MAHSDAPHISMETAIAAKETQLASVENVRRASVELQRACQDIVREADREKEDTREKEHALQDSLAYIAIEPYRERLPGNRRGALILGYKHSAGLQRYVTVVAEEKSDYCKLAEACSEEQKRNILKRLRDDSPADHRNAEQAASTECEKDQEGVKEVLEEVNVWPTDWSEFLEMCRLRAQATTPENKPWVCTCGNAVGSGSPDDAATRTGNQFWIHILSNIGTESQPVLGSSSGMQF